MAKYRVFGKWGGAIGDGGSHVYYPEVEAARIELDAVGALALVDEAGDAVLILAPGEWARVERARTPVADEDEIPF